MTKKKIVRLTESDLHRIVKESVNRALNEGIGETTQFIDMLDDELAKFGDVRVSRFYCTDGWLTVGINKEVYGCKRDVVALLADYGYELYDAGQNDEYVMLTFEKVED